ncbi:MAG: HipA domain-containing protein [Verrucomicrobiaceae bacterium]|nr:HipA domain-containing protein [Verrucomicrobiaceae bacterium]
MKRRRSKPLPYPIINRSGLHVPHSYGLPSLKKGKFHLLEAAVAGDAPKDFLRIYQYGHGRRSRPCSWLAWIAKVGHKYYPNESITEHLLTRVGQSLGLKVADSQLMWFRGQLRFLSRYFLRPKCESLVHGAEIFAGYLEDRAFVEEVELKDEARNLFTFQFVEQALENRFPDHWENLLREFTRLLAFDAIVGNNDRHFYNWGVIVDVTGKRPPAFSPIFDTARALYWNTTESRLAEIARDKNRRKSHQSKYVERCYPKTGWDGVTSPNHFGLIRAICEGRPALREVLQEIPVAPLTNQLRVLLTSEFRKLISPLRADFMLECLDRRAMLFQESVQVLT